MKIKLSQNTEVQIETETSEGISTINSVIKKYKFENEILMKHAEEKDE